MENRGPHAAVIVRFCHMFTESRPLVCASIPTDVHSPQLLQTLLIRRQKTCCVGNPADRSNSKAVVLILFSMENHTCPELRKGAGYPKTCPKSRLFEGQASAASEAFCRCHFSFPILDFCAHAATLKTNYQAASHYALDSLHEPWPRHESCKMKVPR